MGKAASEKVDSHLGALRRSRKLPVAALAAAAGIRRQTLYAIEAGTYAPNTAVALRLARALQVSVEDLFTLPNAAAPLDLPEHKATLLPGSGIAQPGQLVQLCRVGDRLVASVPSPIRWYLPDYDATLKKTTAQIHNSGGDFRNRILIAGCDPCISVLTRHLHAAGVELVAAHRNSSQALKLLRQGFVHVAGTHLRDEASGESNVRQVGRLFAKSAVAVVSLAVWEEGIVTAANNPKRIRSMEDLAREGVRIVNREPGSGSRHLLDSHLKRAGIDARVVAGYEQLAAGHLAAASQVHAGAADCCVATRVAARLFGLAFVPLVSERYDLVMRRSSLDLPPVRALLDTLCQAGFRRELEAIGGYDTAVGGRRIV